MDEKWQYTTSSSYKIQFANNFSKIKICPIWKAIAEPKCRFFAWTLLHKRMLTADNLQKMGRPSNLVCFLCNSSPETSVHLCKKYNYTVEVWDKILTWANLSFPRGLDNSGSLYAWWRKLWSVCSKGTRSFSWPYDLFFVAHLVGTES